jgi:Cd2+/Zn2+-exporting ATPase
LQRQLLDHASPVRAASRVWSGWRDHAADSGDGLPQRGKRLAALRRGQLNMNALMGVAVTGAFLIGQWPEAAMVMALYAIAELIEARSVDRARNAIKGLLDLTPETAEVRQADGTWLEVPPQR